MVRTSQNVLMNELLRLGQVQNVCPRRAASYTLRSNMSHLVWRDGRLETAQRANFSGGNDESTLPRNRSPHRRPLSQEPPKLLLEEPEWGKSS